MNNNPWMAFWLGGAKALMGPVEQAASFGQRQAAVISAKAAEDMMSMWFTAWTPQRPQPLRKRSR